MGEAARPIVAKDNEASSNPTLLERQMLKNKTSALFVTCVVDLHRLYFLAATIFVPLESHVVFVCHL